MINNLKKGVSNINNLFSKGFINFYKVMFLSTLALGAVKLMGIPAISWPIVVFPVVAPAALISVGVGTCIIGIKTIALFNTIGQKIEKKEYENDKLNNFNNGKYNNNDFIVVPKKEKTIVNNAAIQFPTNTEEKEKTYVKR
ncbi:MAG: hypothetical protein PHN42_01755 [Bacilli bacterium]|nr:hypothetical protein [Bacilli bacterium]